MRINDPVDEDSIEMTLILQAIATVVTYLVVLLEVSYNEANAVKAILSGNNGTSSGGNSFFLSHYLDSA